jgi:hypothetical protein
MRYQRFAIAFVIALCALTVQAQSGRRQTKPPPAAPVPTPTPEPTPTPKKEEKERELLFILGADRTSSYSTFPFSYYDAVLRGCGDRLRAGSSASVDISEQSVSRGDAIKKAKSETGAYVVLLTLTFDSMARSAEDLIVEYVVFAPTTSKVVTNGRSYLNSNRKGPIVVGRRSTNALYLEQMLKQAGEDAGSRILKALHLNVTVTQ